MLDSSLRRHENVSLVYISPNGRMMIRTPVLFILLCVAWPRILVRGSSQLPRGASPAEAVLYVTDGSGQFTCRDGSKKIPYARVNDDYCDCEDGSDEPGTSACLNGVFYCANNGDEAKTLRSMFVDDGVCDCCDGSDEPKGTCPDVCREIGRETLKRVEQELADAKLGLSKRAGLEKLVTWHYNDEHDVFDHTRSSKLHSLRGASEHSLADGSSTYVFLMFPSLLCMAFCYAGRRQILASPGGSVWRNWRTWKVRKLSKKLLQRLPKSKQSQSLNV